MGEKMTPEIKQRIEQIRRGEVPEGYRYIRNSICPIDWTMKRVGDCIEEYREISNDIQSFPVYSSSRKGLVLQSEYYDQKKTEETNLGYKIVPNGYVTYRHMSDDDVFHFNINQTGGAILVSSEYPVFTSANGVAIGFLIPALNDTVRFRYFCRTQKLGGTRTRLYLKNLSQYRLSVPCFQEQQKIAAILTTQEKVIELKEKRLAEKQRQKKYLMQQLLTGKKRLPGFSGEWKTECLGNLFSERTETNCEDLEMLAITGTQGIIPRKELDLKDNSSDDKSKYLKVCVGDIGYNTMRMWQGVSAYSNYEGIVSPAYTILKPNSSVDAKYFAYLFKKQEVISLFYRFSQGLVDDTRNLKYENFKRIKVFYPPDIKALMQLLLTGIVRVNV